MVAEKKLTYLLFIGLFFCFTNSLNAQNFGIAVSPGLINYGGDLQKKPFTFSQSELAISGSLLYNINHFTIRGTATYGKIQGSDSTGGYRSRNLSFQSKLGELNLCLQYNLFKLEDKKITPYAFAGVGVFYYNPYTIYNGKRVNLRDLGTEGQGLARYPDRQMYLLTQFAVPLGLGVKYKINDQFQVALEFCSRLLFTDYLDDVSTTYPDEDALLFARGQLAVDVSYRGDEINPSNTFPSDKQRGNASNNDNYYTSSISVIYILPWFQGNNNAFGGFGGGHKKIRSIPCPKL